MTKVLSVKVIMELLDKGNILNYRTIEGKVHVIDIDSNILGSVRFDTFLKISKDLVKPSKQYGWYCDSYIKKVSR